MTDHKLACPPGVRLYVSDQAHARAVRELWDTKTRVPGELPVGDWPDYGRAWLTAQAVKVDLLVFMHELWMRTWGEAFRKQVPGCRFLAEGELAGKDVDAGNMRDAFGWTMQGDDVSDHTLFVVVEMPDGGVIETTVFLDGQLRAGLWFGNLARTLRRPGSSWTLYEDTGFTGAALAPVTPEGLDIGSMVQLANEAVAANM
jgi:hypothetical protein